VRRKTVSGIMLSLLLIGMFILAFNIQQAESSDDPVLMTAGTYYKRWSYTTGGQWVRIAISSNGEYIVASSDKIYLFGRDSNIPIWSYDTTGSIAISQNGSYIAVGSPDHKVYLFSKDSNTPLWSYDIGNPVSCIDISADGNYIVVGTWANLGEPTIYLFSKDSNIPVWSRAEGMEVRALAISGDSNYIVAAVDSDRLYLFARQDDVPLWWAIVNDPIIITSVAISYDGTYIVTGDWSHDIHLFSKESATPLWNYDVGHYVYEVDISGDGEYIVAGASCGAFLFARTSSKPIWKYESYIEHVAISTDGKYITAGGFYCHKVYFFSRDQGVPIWNYDTGNVVTSVSISSSGDYIAAGDRDQGNAYFFTTSPPPATGKTIYVDDDFVDAPLSHQWDTIQEGIDDASPGDTVFVYAGTYYENVEITKEGITLQGEDMSAVVIDGGGSGDCISLRNAHYVTIKGFTIQNASSGIKLDSSCHNYITNISVSNQYVGIIVENSSLHNIISDNDIFDNGSRGIFMHGSTHNDVSTNTVHHNNGRGIELIHSGNNTLFANTIDSNYGRGIDLYGSNNNNISRNTITNNSLAPGDTHWGQSGISIHSGSEHNRVSGNEITNNDGYGIALLSSANTICNNSVNSNKCGIWLDGSDNNTISENNINENNGRGIWLDSSSNNTLRKNDASNNKYNFVVYGSSLAHYIQDIDDSNTVNGKPVYYWVNKQDMAVPLDAGWIALLNCTRVTVKNLNLTNNGPGIILALTTNSTITKNNITNNWGGILLYWSSNNMVSVNNINENNERGISLDGSNYNNISGNNITANNDDSIWLDMSSSFNTISGNHINKNNGNGICLVGSNNTISGNNITNNSGNGVWLDRSYATFSSFNTISGNHINKNNHGIVLYWVSNTNNAVFGNNINENNGDGIWLTGSNNAIFGNNINENNNGIKLWSSSNNNITGNGITNNYRGISLSRSSNNTIYHNNFVDNTEQVYSDDSTNVWDDGYPSGGNYWSDYAGADVKSGPNQDQPSSDGIGDTPYVIDENNQDNYPLMYTGPFHQLTVTSSPITGIQFTINGAPKTTPYTEWLLAGSYTLEMPETHTVGEAKYYWNQWGDGVTSRSRTVAMDTEITLTGDFVGPHYELTVASSPITGIQFTIDGVPQTTLYTEWLLEGSYTLIMPETHNGYIWSHWLEDGDTNRIKTILLQGTTWTAVYEPAPKPVGGKATPIHMPMNKPETPTLWIWLTTIIFLIVLTLAYVTKRKRHTKINYQTNNQSAPTA